MLLDTTDPLGQAPRANTSCSARRRSRRSAEKVQNVVGQYLPQSPVNKWSVNGIYTLRFDPGSLALSASVIWRDKSYGTIFNRTYNTMPSYYLLNLRATWTDTQNRYTVSAFANNVFNPLWADNASGLLFDSGNPVLISGKEIIDRNFTYGAPFTAGVELQLRWR